MRRSLDILLSTAALLVLSPLLLVVAVAVMLDSGGGAFYLARRSGKAGKTFRMWKFRTMVTGAAKLGAITGRGDARITRMGRILRASKIDELPQFINVLMGQMSLVGPRPESPEIVALYTPEQRKVLAAKPGVTGRVQLDSGEESDQIPMGVHADDYYVQHLMNRKIQTDLSYLSGRTLLSDTKILMETAVYILHSLIRLTTKKQIGQDVKEVL